MKLSIKLIVLLLIRRLTFVLCSFLLISCQAQILNVELIAQSVQCNNTSQTIKRLASSSEVTNLLSNPNIIKDSPIVEQYDFNQYLYIFVGAGAKPSTGFRFEQQGGQALLSQNKIVLPLKLIEPGEGLMTAQILTSPCVVLRINQSEFEGINESDFEFILKDEFEAI